MAVSPPRPGSSWVGAGIVLAVGTFAMGTDSFVLAGILPQISSGFDIPLGAAGQVITAFALTYAIAAPFLAAASSRLPRRALLVLALSLFVAANLLAAWAPTFTVLLFARIVTAMAAALFTPTANAAVMTLAGQAKRGRALSLILGGLAMGTVFGVPAGTAIGQALGWRASLLFVAAVASIALIAVGFVLPTLPASASVPLTARLAVMTRGPVVLLVSITTIATTGGFLFYSYVSDLLAHTASVTGLGLTIALLAWGVGGSIGAFGSGSLADRWGANRTLVVALGLMALALAGLGFAPTLPTVLPLMVVGGAASWSVITPINHRLTGIASAAPGVSISFNSSGNYLGQALGAIVGGVLLGSSTIPSGMICVIAALVAVVALGVHLLSTRLRDV